MTDPDLIRDLQTAYDAKAQERDRVSISPWKAEERGRFLAELQREGKTRLLEIGSGPGRDAGFFRDNGVSVVCVDLSAEMVALCREKGLEAFQMDFQRLDFPVESFDAVFALNCLLHVPKPSLRAVLHEIDRILRPGGLFYMGVYGGKDYEGPLPTDNHEPKRFFSLYEDQRILAIVAEILDLVYFRRIELPKPGESHFQSMMLRSRPEPTPVDHRPT